MNLRTYAAAGSAVILAAFDTMLKRLTIATITATGHTPRGQRG
ncbi:MAG TPA: hypothetical protein VHD36_15735 [Pirellulales bacterium]|nr:hypothetical protein [Pirellulales bacterium]